MTATRATTTPALGFTTRRIVSSRLLRQRLARIAFDSGGLLGLAALIIYVALAPAHIVDGDNAEFSTLGTIGGVPHPTGYPLYMLWLRAMSWLPGHSPAHTASIATAILGATAVIVLHAACRAWGARPLAATIAVAIYAASPVVVEMNTEAEAFALNSLIAATVLWLAACGGPMRGLWRAGALGLIAGLGLSDHVTCVLVAPVGILGVVRAAREARAIPAVAIALAGLVVGLLPYVYLLVTAENPMSWGQHIDSLHALVRHVLREDYGGPGAFAPNRPPIPIADNLLELVRMLGRTWLWAPLAIGLGAFVARLRRASDGEPRWGWAMLAVSFVIAGPLLVMRFNDPLEGPGLFTVHRFMLLPALILVIPIASGIDAIGAWAVHRAGERIATRRRLGDVLGVGVFVAIVTTSLAFVQGAHSPAVEQGVRNLLDSLPQDAVVIISEDDLDFGSGYVQLMLGERRDVTVIMWTAVPFRGYRERLEQRLGIAVPEHGSELRSVDYAAALLARGHALFVDSYEAHILAAFPTYPYGILLRVLPVGTPRPSITEVLAINKALYAKFEFGYPVPSYAAHWPAHVHERYARTWIIIRDALIAAGLHDDAAFANQIALELMPQ